MTTNSDLEMMAGRMYPRAMKHLQQLIMDAEKCAKAFGKTTLFGADKFEPACEKFMRTVGVCAVALVEDGHLDSADDMDVSMIEISNALTMLELVQRPLNGFNNCSVRDRAEAS